MPRKWKPPRNSRTPSTPSSTGSIPFYGLHKTISQWSVHDFTIPNNGNTMTSSTAEQYMMYHKAILFNDAAIASEILHTSDPRAQRALGRAVAGFDEATWCEARSRIVEGGNYWKFKSDPAVLEASPRDRVRGVGFGAVRAPAERLNLLGKALMETRTRLREERTVE